MSRLARSNSVSHENSSQLYNEILNLVTLKNTENKLCGVLLAKIKCESISKVHFQNRAGTFPIQRCPSD